MSGFIAGLIGVVAFGACLFWGLSTGTMPDIFLRGVGDGDREEAPDAFWFLTIVYSLAAFGFAALALVSFLSGDRS
ncbi:hypothetical protein OKW76_15485 [Sphingomonas sp. S1-29]|uniref:hypothetical protein n=1 Tax=Sphingomonas sp. S1-29 TaxID=2991074 RepID=UPI0022404D30|nr:hypothetical protein [Sphingomonas sp. S1-29]UZK69391.1 hypothetical protein OKW76_15485 [Sphingomonas sp. S1-29]